MRESKRGAPGVVVVTGASTGIGQACARHLDRLGFTVLAGVRSDEAAAALREGVSERLRPLRLDVTDADSIAAAAEEARRSAGDAGLAGLVNNADIAVSSPLEFVPLDLLRRQLEVNVVGQVAVTQALLPLLREGRGRVVNMGSTAGLHATPFLGPYSASKHALEALTDSLRVELSPWGIHVVIIEPGTIATPIWDKAHAAGERLAEQLPEAADRLYGAALDCMARLARELERDGSPPEVVARAVESALCSPRPRTRYLVGAHSRMAAVVRRWVPDRLRDRLVAGRLGLSRESEAVR